MGSEAGTKGAGMAKSLPPHPLLNETVKYDDEEMAGRVVSLLIEEDKFTEAMWLRKKIFEVEEVMRKREEAKTDRSPLTDELIAQYEHDEGRS